MSDKTLNDRNLSGPAPCKCCSSLQQYISLHLDSHAALEATDNAAVVVAELDSVMAEDGGSTGITVGEMQDYLDTL